MELAEKLCRLTVKISGETWACMREYLFGKHYHFILPLRKKALINVNILLWLYNYHYNPVSTSENKLESLSLLLIDVSAIFLSVLPDTVYPSG